MTLKDVNEVIRTSHRLIIEWRNESGCIDAMTIPVCELCELESKFQNAEVLRIECFDDSVMIFLKF